MAEIADLKQQIGDLSDLMHKLRAKTKAENKITQEKNEFYLNK